MKVEAYVLISLQNKNAEEIQKKLMKLTCVKEVKVLFGEWDLLVKIICETTEDLSTFMLDKSRPLKEIKQTSTSITAK